MAICSRCQSENLDTARICRQCGNTLPGQSVAQTGAPGSAPAACPSCGEPASADSQFCASCGTSLTSTACPSCGQAAPADAEFCASCGKSLFDMEYAGFGHRLGGFVIDFIIMLVVGVVTRIILSQGAAPAISLLIGLGYFVGLNANGGTLGKRMVGLRLEDAETGNDLGYPKALIRYIVAIASFLALLLGYFWCIWDGKKQTWHDKAAGSVVVRT